MNGMLLLMGGSLNRFRHAQHSGRRAFSSRSYAAMSPPANAPAAFFQARTPLSATVR